MIAEQENNVVRNGAKKRICRICFSDYNPDLKVCPKCTDISGGVSYPSDFVTKSGNADKISYEFLAQTKKVK